MQKNYRQHIDQVKYHPVTDTPEIILAKKNAQLVSNVSKHQAVTMIAPSLSAANWVCTEFQCVVTCVSAKLQSQLWKDQTSVHALPGPAPNQEGQSQCWIVQWCEFTQGHFLSFAAQSHSHRQSLLMLHLDLSLQIKYKEEWQKTKSKACDIGVDDLSVRAAKASRDLASDVSERTLFPPLQGHPALMSDWKKT